MKKVLAIALVLCLVMGAVFAAKGDIKVGAQLGYGVGFANVKTSEEVAPGVKASIVSKGHAGGLYLTGVGLYDITDEVSVKAAIGINTFGKMKTKVSVTVAGETVSDEQESPDTMPTDFSIYLGGQYAFAVTKEIKIAAGAGLDMAIGKTSKADDAKTNCSIGIGAEVIGSYSINKQLDVNIGARYSFYFIDTDENLKETRKYYRDNGGSYTETALRIFASATYKI